MKNLFLLIAITLITPFANAAYINAADFDVGTNVSNLNPKYTLSIWDKYYGDETIYSLPVIIKDLNRRIEDSPNNVRHYFAGSNYQGSGTFELNDMRNFVIPNYFNEPKWARFSGLHIQSDFFIDEISFVANANSPDTNLYYLFDESGNYILSKPVPGTNERLLHEQGYLYSVHTGTIDLRGLNVKSILIGSSLSSSFYHKLNVEIPEPNPLSLLLLSLIALFSAEKIRSIKQYNA